jgi:hypothetical protein
MNYSPAEPTTPHISGRMAAPRSLTYDEKKAAEAAFRCDAFNPAWSQAAWRVYEDITKAMVRLQGGSKMDHESE